MVGTLDLEADVNVIPLEMLKRLRLTGKTDVCGMSYDVGMCIVKNYGTLRNVLIKIGTLIVPVDLLIVDYENDNSRNLYLGRLFMIMTNTIIDITGKRVSMFVNGLQNDVELSIGRMHLKRGKLVAEKPSERKKGQPPGEFQDALTKMKEIDKNYFYSHDTLPISGLERQREQTLQDLSGQVDDRQVENGKRRAILREL